MEPETKAKTVQVPPHHQLRCGILRPDARHYSTAALGINVIGHVR
jgi:hypothetical protein